MTSKTVRVHLHLHSWIGLEMLFGPSAIPFCLDPPSPPLSRPQKIYSFPSALNHSWHSSELFGCDYTYIRRQTKPKKGAKTKSFMNFAIFVILVFFLRKQARWTFVPECPREKVHELAFLWFGLQGWLLIILINFWDFLWLMKGYPSEKPLLEPSPLSLVTVTHYRTYFWQAAGNTTLRRVKPVRARTSPFPWKLFCSTFLVKSSGHCYRSIQNYYPEKLFILS